MSRATIASPSLRPAVAAMIRNEPIPESFERSRAAYLATLKDSDAVPAFGRLLALAFAALWSCFPGHLSLLCAIALTFAVCRFGLAVEVPTWALRGIAAVETGTEWHDMGDLHYRDRRVGADGEVGPWQLAPCALKDLGVEHLRSRIHREPILAESMTRAWLLRCYARTGNWFDAVRIYHTGPDGDRRRGMKYAERVLSAGTTINQELPCSPK